MKKAFTLVELVVVILIIWILFWAIGYLSWSYVHKLNIENDKQTIQSVFYKAQSIALSQPVFKNEVLSYIGIKLIPEKKYILQVGSTWFLENYFSLDAKPLYYLQMWSGFYVYSGSNLTFLNTSGVFLYKSYKLWAYFYSNWNVYSGNKIVKFSFEDKNHSYKVCFSINLLSGRLFSVKCN